MTYDLRAGADPAGSGMAGIDRRRLSGANADASARRGITALTFVGLAATLVLTASTVFMPAFLFPAIDGSELAATAGFSHALSGLRAARERRPLAQKFPRFAHPAPPPPREAASAPQPASGRIGRSISPPQALVASQRPASLAHRLAAPRIAEAVRLSQPAAAVPSEDAVTVASAAPIEVAALPAVHDNAAPASAPVPAGRDVPAASVAPPAADIAPPESSLAALSREIEGLSVPTPTFRPAVRRAEPAPEAPRAAPPRAAPSPLLAYARPDAGSLSVDPPAVTVRPSSTPSLGAGTAIYDIAAATVYLPNGEQLEAHSGLGTMRDNPRFVHARNRGPTPPHTYDLTLRESLFHGVQAIRLTPVGGERHIYNRVGLLAHTYMLGRQGDSNGCVSFKDYKRFLAAFRRGDVRRLVVVPHLEKKPDAASLLARLFTSKT